MQISLAQERFNAITKKELYKVSQNFTNFLTENMFDSLPAELLEEDRIIMLYREDYRDKRGTG